MTCLTLFAFQLLAFAFCCGYTPRGKFFFILPLQNDTATKEQRTRGHSDAGTRVADQTHAASTSKAE